MSPGIHPIGNIFSRSTKSLRVVLHSLFFPTDHATVQGELESCPSSHNDRSDWSRRAAWKYVGYPGLSKWLASDERFTIRRFADLNVRALLSQQNEIAQLERQLNEIDHRTMEGPLDEGGCGSLRIDAQTPRGALMAKLGKLLQQYNERVKTFLQLQEQPSASTAQLDVFRQWLAEHPNVVEESEQDFAYREPQELITTRRSCTSKRGAWTGYFDTSDTATFPDIGLEAISGKNKCRLLLSRASSVFPLLMLLGPTWTMAFTADPEMRLTVVSLFTVLFFVFLVLSTHLRPLHRCVAIAGYFALLLLILGLVPAEAYPAMEMTKASDTLRWSDSPANNVSSADYAKKRIAIEPVKQFLSQDRNHGLNL